MDNRHSDPLPFAVYYGWPSALPGRERLKREFEVVFLGANLEHEEHPDHQAARDLVSYLRDGGVSSCGYFDLSLMESQHTVTDFENRFKLMAQMKMDGVLLDNAGRDHGVDKQTRVLAIEAAHSLKLYAVLNAGDPGEALFGLPMDAADGYLLEGYRLANGERVSGYTMDAKCSEAKRYRDLYGINLFAIATLKPGAGVDSSTAGGPEGIGELWQAAAKDGLDYFSITDPLYGASGPSKDRISSLR